ncbi:MAG: hypothetical protein ACI4JM_00860, partial [Oscillospiraceae bacterium]
CPAFFKKLADSKGRAFGRRPQTAKLQGVRGRSPCLSIRYKKVFWQPFYKKRLGGFQPPDEISNKSQRATNGRPFCFLRILLFLFCELRSHKLFLEKV